MLQDTHNTALEAEFNTLALNLRNMWFQHGYTGLRYFRQHIADIYNRFHHLLDEDRVDPATVRAAMGACDELVALKTVPNESWLPYVAGIRRTVSMSSPTISTLSSPEGSPLEERSLSTFSSIPEHPGGGTGSGPKSAASAVVRSSRCASS